MCTSPYEHDILIQSAKDEVLFARAGGRGERGAIAQQVQSFCLEDEVFRRWVAAVAVVS